MLARHLQKCGPTSNWLGSYNAGFRTGNTSWSALCPGISAPSGCTFASRRKTS
ncbi:hypothetical protein ACLBOM_37535 [Escherichia coli]